jgi:hypothetical protein
MANKPVKFKYLTCCVDVCESEDLEALALMVKPFNPITYDTFRKKVDLESFREVTSSLGYGPDFPISRDWHVGYYKSAWKGEPCIYFKWSAIEYIFVLPKS